VGAEGQVVSAACQAGWVAHGDKRRANCEISDGQPATRYLVKRFLLPHLICPACLPKEHRLDLSPDAEVADDISSGQLICVQCRRRYPLRDGVAYLLPAADGGSAGGQLRYEEGGMVDRYLWSHYADLCGVAGNGTANAAWADCLSGGDGAAVDAGCAVGRLTFAMAARSSWAVGCDLSGNFIKAARTLARDRQLTFSLPLEGNLRETFKVPLPAALRSDNAEFIVADALRLPFRRETFQQSASLNLLDRVSYPLAHLFEMNRVASRTGAAFLFASPFSWAASSAPEELWLGGKAGGEYRGAGIDNVRSLLAGKGGILTPPWQISWDGTIPWQIRSHCRHHELITSEFLLAVR
jgi:uncharacterized protein YbaR (Trm112 family)